MLSSSCILKATEEEDVRARSRLAKTVDVRKGQKAKQLGFTPELMGRLSSGRREADCSLESRSLLKH